MLSILTQLLPIVGEVIDRVIPDPKGSIPNFDKP